MTTQKRYEYWGQENGVPVKKWTKWLEHHGPKEKYQLKPNLLNEYREL